MAKKKFRRFHQFSAFFIILDLSRSEEKFSLEPRSDSPIVNSDSTPIVSDSVR